MARVEDGVLGDASQARPMERNSRKLIRMFRNYMNTRSDSAEEGRRIETLAVDLRGKA